MHAIGAPPSVPTTSVPECPTALESPLDRLVCQKTRLRPITRLGQNLVDDGEGLGVAVQVVVAVGQVVHGPERVRMIGGEHPLPAGQALFK